jgi:mono/diheme cytochrome c family protein
MTNTKRNGSALLAAALLLATSGCTRIDNALASVPFLAFMRSSPSFDPYEATRPAPPNTVPYESPAGEYVPPIASVQMGPVQVATEAGLREFAAGPWGTNPFAGEDLLPVGEERFAVMCAVCHGPRGQGDGTVVGQDRYPPLAPNLTRPETIALPDGYIYGVIRAGRGLMPAYGARINHRERWAIVEYVRQLQRQAGGAPAPAQNPTGGE